MMNKRAYPARTSALEDFLALSRVLTGVNDLDADFGRQYLDRLMSTPFAPQLEKILALFGELPNNANRGDAVKKQIVGSPALSATVCQIVLLWYTSTMQDGLPGNAGSLRYGSQEEYFTGLAWPIIGAHVPGVSGGYFGHWRYRPDNEP